MWQYSFIFFQFYYITISYFHIHCTLQHLPSNSTVAHAHTCCYAAIIPVSVELCAEDFSLNNTKFWVLVRICWRLELECAGNVGLIMIMYLFTRGLFVYGCCSFESIYRRNHRSTRPRGYRINHSRALL